MIKFELNEKEEESANEFIETQKKKKKSPQTAIGGRFSYIFSPNSVGCGIIIVDNLTKKQKDITDYDCW